MDVEALFAEVQAAGATLLTPATVTDWGGYSGIVNLMRKSLINW
jgi:uncharacterized glyoxalase superfamily protein PhnB